MPRVSVLIPTYRRPHLVGRAVESALAQTLDDLEVCVVLDGPDPATAAALDGIADPRLRRIVLPERAGNGAALNAGVAAARAPWIALLDDDDEWMPDKLRRQLVTAEGSIHPDPVVSCRFLARDERGDRLWPRRLPDEREPLSEYLFCRRGPFFGEGLLAIMTLLVPARLLRRISFDASLPRHGDLDWLLRASVDPAVGFQFVPGDEPLAIWNMEAARSRLSTAPDWRVSRSWIDLRRAEVTARARASFLLTWVAASAVKEEERRALPGIAWAALRGGGVDPWAALAFLAIALLPRRSRERLSFRGMRATGQPAAERVA